MNLTIRTSRAEVEMAALRGESLHPQTTLVSFGSSIDCWLGRDLDDAAANEVFRRDPRLAWAFCQALKEVRSPMGFTLQCEPWRGWTFSAQDCICSWVERSPDFGRRFAQIRRLQGYEKLRFAVGDRWQIPWLESRWLSPYDGIASNLNRLREEILRRDRTPAAFKAALKAFLFTCLYVEAVDGTLFNINHCNTARYTGIAEGDVADQVLEARTYNSDWFGSPGCSYEFIPEHSEPAWKRFEALL